MRSLLQRNGLPSFVHSNDTPLAEEGMSPRLKMTIVFITFLVSLIIDYAVLIYLGNPGHQIIIFIMILEIFIFATLLVHVLMIRFSGLRVYDDYFVLPHQGFYAILKSTRRKVLFREINVAFIHSGRAEGRAQLRIKLASGNAIPLRQGDLGVGPSDFDALIKQIGLRDKLDTAHFRS